MRRPRLKPHMGNIIFTYAALIPLHIRGVLLLNLLPFHQISQSEQVFIPGKCSSPGKLHKRIHSSCIGVIGQD